MAWCMVGQTIVFRRLSPSRDLPADPRQFRRSRDLSPVREYMQALALRESAAGLVPNDRQIAAVIRKVVEAKPVPLPRGNQGVDYEVGVTRVVVVVATAIEGLLGYLSVLVPLQPVSRTFKIIGHGDRKTLVALCVSAEPNGFMVTTHSPWNCLFLAH